MGTNLPPPPPSFGNPTMDRPVGHNGKAIASMVLGIIGVLVFGVILGPLAIIFAVLARREIAATGQAGRGMATAGLVLGIIAVAAFFIFLPFVFSDR